MLAKYHHSQHLIPTVVDAPPHEEENHFPPVFLCYVHTRATALFYVKFQQGLVHRYVFMRTIGCAKAFSKTV